jgi:hypothetical protein
MITVLVPVDVRSTPNIPRKPPTVSFTHARASRATIVAKPPTTMKGFLLPQDERQLSLQIPIYGCTSVPVRGPAIQTKASKALLIPRDRRKGYTHNVNGCFLIDIRVNMLTDPFDNSTDQTI